MVRYEIIIYWSTEDEAFIAEVPELPGCMADGPTYQEALRNVEIVVGGRPDPLCAGATGDPRGQVQLQCMWRSRESAGQEGESEHEGLHWKGGPRCSTFVAEGQEVDMAKWLVLVESDSTDATREGEFNDWYNKTHVPDALETPGVVRATRYEALDRTSPTDRGLTP